MVEEGWSQLPSDLLAMIIEYLPSADCARFRSVCTAWNSAPLPLPPPTQPPWLLLSPSLLGHGSSAAGDERKSYDDSNGKVKDGERCKTSFYSVSDNKMHESSDVHLVDAIAECRAIVSYSPRGWLMYMDKVCELQCVNLVTGERIHPPLITTIPEIKGVRTDRQGNIIGYNFEAPGDPDNVHFRSCDEMCWFYRQGIIIFPDDLLSDQFGTAEYHSTRGTRQEYVIVVAHHIWGKLALARQGDSSWTLGDSHCNRVSSLILHKGSLYVATGSGREIYYVDISSDSSFHSDTANAILTNFSLLTSGSNRGTSACYLVHLDGDLWLIWRMIDLLKELKENANTNSFNDFIFTPKTCRFRVFKFDDSRLTWVEMDTIGGYAVFVGKNYPLALSTHDYPHLARDCIYFTDDYEENYLRPTCWDLGVFNLLDKSVSPLCEPLIARDLPQPTWITPLPL